MTFAGNPAIVFFSIMTRHEEQFQQYFEWFGATDPSHPINIALSTMGIINTSKLADLIRTPGGLDKLRYKDSTTNDDKELDSRHKLEV